MKSRRIWVDDDFAKMLRTKAIELDLSMLKLTKLVAKDGNLERVRKKHDYRF